MSILPLIAREFKSDRNAEIPTLELDSIEIESKSNFLSIIISQHFL